MWIVASVGTFMHKVVSYLIKGEIYHCPGERGCY